MKTFKIGFTPEDCKEARRALVQETEPVRMITYDEKVGAFPWMAIEVTESARRLDYYQTLEGAVRALLYEEK